MSLNYKPTGYNSLSPYFLVEKAEEWIDLLKQVFSVTELRKYLRTDGSIMHMELKIDDTVIMMGSTTNEFGPNHQMIHLYVPNVDAVFKKALELGCEAIQKPMKKEGDTDKRGAFKDFAGNDWWIATQSSM